MENRTCRPDGAWFHLPIVTINMPLLTELALPGSGTPALPSPSWPLMRMTKMSWPGHVPGKQLEHNNHCFEQVMVAGFIKGGSLKVSEASHLTFFRLVSTL